MHKHTLKFSAFLGLMAAFALVLAGCTVFKYEQDADEVNQIKGPVTVVFPDGNVTSSSNGLAVVVKGKTRIYTNRHWMDSEVVGIDAKIKADKSAELTVSSLKQQVNATNLVTIVDIGANAVTEIAARAAAAYFSGGVSEGVNVITSAVKAGTISATDGATLISSLKTAAASSCTNCAGSATSTCANCTPAAAAN